MQMTIRNISKALREKLVEKSKAEGKSLNQAALDLMNAGAGLDGGKKVYHDMDWFFGSGLIGEAEKQAMAEHDVVHPDEWK